MCASSNDFPACLFGVTIRVWEELCTNVQHTFCGWSWIFFFFFLAESLFQLSCFFGKAQQVGEDGWVGCIRLEEERKRRSAVKQEHSFSGHHRSYILLCNKQQELQGLFRRRHYLMWIQHFYLYFITEITVIPDLVLPISLGTLKILILICFSDSSIYLRDRASHCFCHWETMVCKSTPEICTFFFTALSHVHV